MQLDTASFDDDEDRVWEFYMDINNFEITTPKEIKLMVMNATRKNLVRDQKLRLN